MNRNASRTDWLPLDGNWTFDGNNATFEHDRAAATDSGQLAGMALSTVHAQRGGCLSADVALPENLDGNPAARLLVGYDAASKDYYTVGLGGYGAAYVLHEFRDNVHRQLHGVGRLAHLRPSWKYHVAVSIHSHRVTLTVDGISVFTENLPRPPSAQAGVFAHAHGVVRFEAFDWAPRRGKAFVVMKFDEPCNSLYKSVIKPICDDGGFDTERADDVYRPGAILQDNTAALGTPDVVIAEISPVDANVFYEVGYAHACQTPTILLARRGEQLPFDVSGYRTIFYENTIGAKDDVAADLRRHLANIR